MAIEYSATLQRFEFRNYLGDVTDSDSDRDTLAQRHGVTQFPELDEEGWEIVPNELDINNFY